MTTAEIYTQLPTYDSLLDMLKVYLNRRDADTVGAMPFFINSAEKTILRMLRIPSVEKMVQVDTSTMEDGYMELPYDYIEMRFMWTDGDNTKGTLQRVPFDQLLRGGPTSVGSNPLIQESTVNLTTQGTYAQGNSDFNTGYWSINGNRLYICTSELDAIVKMTYYYDVPELNSTTQENPLLTLLPDAFLYLAVAEGWKFLMEPEKAAMWEQFALARVGQIQQQADEAEYSGSPTTINPI